MPKNRPSPYGFRLEKPRWFTPELAVFCLTLLVYLLLLTARIAMAGNELAHYAQAEAMLDGRLDIQGPLSRRGLDRAMFEGRVYSNKPPGFPLLLVPVLALSRALVGELSMVQEITLLRIMPMFFGALASAALVRAAIVVGVGHVAAIVSGLAFAFATLMLLYVDTLSAHSLSTLCISALIVAGLTYRKNRDVRWLMMAAFASSYAPVVQINTLFIVMPCWLTLFFTATDHRHRAWMIVCSLPAVATLLIFNHQAFGSPFELGYSYYVRPRYVPWEGVTGSFSFKAPEHAVRLLFDPGKGLLVYSPYLLLSVPGVAMLWKTRDSFIRTVLLGSVVYFGFVASYNIWHGGHSVGPRHLFPLFPVLALCFARATRDRVGWVVAAAVLLQLSVFANIGAYLVGHVKSLVGKTWLNEPADEHGSLLYLLANWSCLALNGKLPGLRAFSFEWQLYMKALVVPVLGVVVGWTAGFFRASSVEHPRDDVARE